MELSDMGGLNPNLVAVKDRIKRQGENGRTQGKRWKRRGLGIGREFMGTDVPREHGDFGLRRRESQAFGDRANGVHYSIHIQRSSFDIQHLKFSDSFSAVDIQHSIFSIRYPKFSIGIDSTFSDRLPSFRVQRAIPNIAFEHSAFDRQHYSRRSEFQHTMRFELNMAGFERNRELFGDGERDTIPYS